MTQFTLPRGIHLENKIYELSVAQFIELIQNSVDIKQQHEQLLNGIDGLAEYLHCSKSSACRLMRSGRINEATLRYGKIINFDKEKIKSALRI